MIERIKHRYALSDQGAKQMIWACISVALSNLVLMLPIALLYRLASYLLQGQLPENKNFFIVGILVVVVLIVLTTYIQYKATFFSTYVESGIRRRSLSEKLRKLPLSFFNKKDLSDLTNTIMSGCALIETASSHWIPELIGSMISITIIVVALFFFNWKMAFAAVWVMPISFLIVLTSRSKLVQIQKKTVEDRLAMEDGIQESLETIRDLRANHMTAKYMDQLSKKIEKVEKNSIFLEFSNAVYVCSAQMILKFGIGTVAIMGSSLLIRHEIDLLTFFAFLLVVTRMYEPMQIALQNLSAIISMDTTTNRMDEILSHEEQTGSNILSNDGYDIAFNHVGFSYKEGKDVLSDVSFIAKQGQVTALIGPSGSGKTTVSRLAARFWDCKQGTITVGGMDISKVDPETLLSLYSIIFQDVILFNNTILENIRIGKKDASDQEVLEAARLANCMDFIEKLPEGIHTMIGENGSELSGGERQRISIARAFLKDAPIILMDEATASLDVDNESIIQESISKLIKNKTVLIIAHRMRSVDCADKIVVLKDGRIVEQGSAKTLKEQNGVYAHMLELQHRSNEWKYS